MGDIFPLLRLIAVCGGKAQQAAIRAVERIDRRLKPGESFPFRHQRRRDLEDVSVLAGLLVYQLILEFHRGAVIPGKRGQFLVKIKLALHKADIFLMGRLFGVAQGKLAFHLEALIL